MAVQRPSFSRQRAPEKVQVRVRPQKSVKKKKKSSPKKQSSLFRLLTLFSLFVFLLLGTDQGRAPYRYLAAEAQTTIFGNVGLSEAQMKKVALNILTIANNMSSDYEVADGITLTSYILRYFAEIGEYEIAYRDIMILVEAFEKLTNSAVGPEVRDILDQTLKVRFGKRNGLYFAQFFAKNPLKGIIIPIEEVSEDPESSLREIKHVTIAEGAVLSFEDVDTQAEREHVRNFIKKPVKLLGVIDGVLNALNQVYPPLKGMIDFYLEDPEQSVAPLIIGMKGVSVDVATSTVFDDITFDFNEAYALPNFRQGEDALPSFVLGGKSKLLRLKVSIDQ